MVIKLYISGISGNKEVKKKQQRVQMILDSKQINYEAIDITEPGKEKDKEFMQQNGKVRESLGKYPLPPQIFNDDDFCGDYEDFDLANEVDELEKFLHIETSLKGNETDSKQGKELQSKSWSKKQSVELKCNPNEYHTFKVQYDPVNGLKEQIINTNDLSGENNETEVVTKSEVNGECESVPGLEPSSEKTTDVETSPQEVVALEKEESSTQENKANEDGGEKEVEESVNENEEIEVQKEGGEKEEEKEDVEVGEEENVERPKEEKSPHPEEKEVEKEKQIEEVESEKDEEKEELESEKEEKESDNESPQSEKSQEE